MLVLLNKYKYIIGYCDEGFDVENYIKIDSQGKDGKDLCLNYQVINGNLVHNQPSEKPIGIKLEYNGYKWIETATLEEERASSLKKCLELKKKIDDYKSLGFEGRQELIELENELYEYKLKYSSTFEEEALAIDKFINSTKLTK